MIIVVITITLIIFMFITRIITMIIFRFLWARSGAKTIYNLTTTALLVVFINVPFPIYNGSFEKVLFYRKALDLYKLQCTINICVCCLFLENLYMCCCRIETYFWRTNKTLELYLTNWLHVCNGAKYVINMIILRILR